MYRYVDPADNLPREDVIDFLECDTGLSGEALAIKIVGCLESHGVDMTKARGQAFDGAGNMSGATKGAAARITAQYPQALYLHCASHCLNLVVAKSLTDTCKLDKSTCTVSI